MKVDTAPGTPFDHGRFEIVEEAASSPLPRGRVALPVLADAAVAAALREQ